MPLLLAVQPQQGAGEGEPDADETHLLLSGRHDWIEVFQAQQRPEYSPEAAEDDGGPLDAHTLEDDGEGRGGHARGLDEEREVAGDPRVDAEG